MLLAMKNKAGANLKDDENDFMLDNANDCELLEELTVIDTNIIFDDPCVASTSGTSVHDSVDHDPNCDIKTITYNVQKEAENQKRLNTELNKQKEFYKRNLRRIRHGSKQYLKDIVDLQEKMSSHDRIVYKMGQSIRTIHMLEKSPNKVYDPFLKVRLGYKNPKRLKKAITAKPKMYDGHKLDSTNLIIDSPNSEETLEDAKESRLKMRNKMIQLDYVKLNAIFETFFPQQEPSAEQIYFSIASPSTESSVSKYHVPRTLKVSDKSTANTLDNEDTPSSSTTIVEDNDAPEIKKDVIQYPHLTKLIIAHTIEKYHSLPKWLDEEYYSINDDISLVSVYSAVNILFKGMRIMNALLTKEICVTDDFKEPPTSIASPCQKRKQVDREVSSPQTNLKIRIKKPRKETSVPPPSNEREREEITEATLLSLTLHKTALAAEAKENIANVQEKLVEDEIENMVEGEGDEEFYASEFAKSMLNNDVDDFGTRIEPRSHKENPKTVNDDNDDVDVLNEILTKINNLAPELIVAKTNEMIKEALLRFVDQAIKQDREIVTTNFPGLISKEFATHAPDAFPKL
nr:hypothetical protein [Tanacetum cinerariifolium]